MVSKKQKLETALEKLHVKELDEKLETKENHYYDLLRKRDKKLIKSRELLNYLKRLVSFNLKNPLSINKYFLTHVFSKIENIG
jgi:hypothetical protein